MSDPGGMPGPMTFGLTDLLGLFGRCFFKRQRHIAQITLGLYQHQWTRFNGHYRCTLTRHMGWTWLSGHGGLRFGDLAGVGVNPLQARGAGNLSQVLQRQVI